MENDGWIEGWIHKIILEKIKFHLIKSYYEVFLSDINTVTLLIRVKSFSTFKIFYHWKQLLLFSCSHLLFPSPRFFFSSLLLKICVYSIFLSYHLPSNFPPTLILPLSFFFPFSSSTVPFFYFPSSSSSSSFPLLLLRSLFFAIWQHRVTYLYIKVSQL